MGLRTISTTTPPRISSRGEAFLYADGHGGNPPIFQYLAGNPLREGLDETNVAFPSDFHNLAAKLIVVDCILELIRSRRA
ncbi:MAG: hypothetical protein MPW17_16745 [Candidatus Manganitrophus sp.]|nr:MAG: hypothetical protein MPW17_16745 [Candidatus Manganitrophus sp.]